MAAHVLRLRIALLLGAFRGDAGHIARRVVGLLLVAGSTAAACWGVLTLREAPTEVLFAVTVVVGTATALGFALAPLVLGVTDQLDPRRFAVLGLRSGRLAAILAVAGFISVPVFSVVIVSVCAAIVWSERGVPVFVATIGVILAATTCVLLARVSMGLTVLLLTERRSRELAGLFALALVVVVVPIVVFFASRQWRGRVPAALSDAVDILALTPFGAAWALPGRFAQEEARGATVAVALATLAVLAAAWVLLVSRLLAGSGRRVSTRERGGLGWFAVTPGTPGGAIAARSLMYWLRDRRYLVNIVVIPFAAVLTTVPLLVAGVPLEIVAFVPVPIVALFLGWLPHNDVAYDSTAVWMHIASGIRGFSDRIGRLIPVLLIGVPLLAVSVPIAIWVQGRWALLPVLAGVCLSLFLCGLGLSSISSVVSPYAVSRPGESPFQQPQRVGASGAIAQGVVMIGAIVLSIPTLWWAWSAVNGEVEAVSWALWGGLGIGVFVLAVGILIGSAVFTRRGGAIMEFAEST